MPVEPPQDRRPTRSRARRATTGSAVTALAALAALGTVAPAQASPTTAQTVPAAQHADAPGEVTVRPGDSVWSLATAHGVGVREFMAANHLPAHAMLRPGQRLTVPSGNVAGQLAPSAGTASPNPGTERSGTGRSTTEAAPSSARRHTVVAGDTVWALAERHGVSVARLLSANDPGVTSLLRPGQRLEIPAPDEAADPAARDAVGAASSARGRDPAPDAAGAAEPGGGATFAGRTYPPEVVEAADRHRAKLAERELPDTAQVQQMVRATAQRMGVDPALALAHASQESGFRQGAVSPADAVGTMQVIPSAGRWASALVGRDLDLLDSQDNITAGIAIIRELQEKAPDKRTAIGAYYQGLHGVKTYGMFSDTKDYVRAVSAQEQRFAE